MNTQFLLLLGGDAVEKAFNMKRELLERIDLIGDRLPPNMLDQLIDDLGGPDNVAEVRSKPCVSIFPTNHQL